MLSQDLDQDLGMGSESGGTGCVCLASTRGWNGVFIGPVRWEFALVIDAVNRVRRSQRSQPIGLSIRRQVILVTGIFGGGVECRPTALVVSWQSCPGSHLVFSQTSNRQWMTVLGSGNDASVVPFPGVFSCHLLYGLLFSFSPA